MKNALLLLLAALDLAAQTPGMLIGTGQLSERLSDKSLVLLHVGSRKDYDEGHIPGARLITLSEISVTDERGMRLQLSPVPDLVRAFGALGVTDKSAIVIYPAADSIQSATRVWFTLDYLGLGSRAALLDGGLTLWKAQGRPVTAEPAAPVSPSEFRVSPRPDLIVNADFLSSRIRKPGLQIVDARLPEFYTGANAGGMPRAGHLPGAINLPYTTLLSGDRTFRKPDELRAALQARKDTPLVTYCHIGMQATVPYFVAKYLGYEAKLYDGSFQDWSSRTELPVEP